MKIWKQTDETQWVRQIDEDNFEILDGLVFQDKFYLNFVEVNINDYSLGEIEQEISSYYHSFKSMRVLYGKDWKQIVAEIIAENNGIDLEKEIKHPTSYLLENYGIRWVN